MSYKYFVSSLPITNQNYKTQWDNNFNALVNEQFYNASNVYTILQETCNDSKIYENVDVRITHVINDETGKTLQDDYKRLLFKPNTNTCLGRMYQFDDNYWVTIDVDQIKTLVNGVTVKRCNNVLRWLDANGGYHEIPCSIGFNVLENRNYTTGGSTLVNSAGIIDCWLQLNDESNLIGPNQRFIIGRLGNWTCYRVQGGGISNFNNMQTFNNESSALLKLTLGFAEINDQKDDLVRGIANYYDYEYSIVINEGDVEGNVGGQVQLSATTILNGQTVTRPLTWTSSNTAIATVSSTGKVTLLSAGQSTIRCQIENNTTVYDEINVDVISTPVYNYEVVITPNSNYIYVGETRTYTVKLYLNGLEQGNTFVFALNPNTVPTTSYTYTAINGNSFSIKNNKEFLTDDLTVTCTSGTHIRELDISLLGAW